MGILFRSQLVKEDKMNDYAKVFKAFVCPYLSVFFGSCIGFLLTTGQAVDQLLWVIFLGALTELGIEFGALPVAKKLKKS